MANKTYITLKKMNAVLSLYGVVVLKEYAWGRTSTIPTGCHLYLTKLENEHNYSWDIPRYYLPDIKPNQKLLEFVLENLGEVL